MKILPNGIAVIEGDTHISKWVEQAGRLDHDQNVLPLLMPHIPKGGTVIDVGAFIGDHTEFYAQAVGPEGRVFALEPNPEAFACLEANMRQRPNVFCYGIGASDRTHSISVEAAPNAGASRAVDGGELDAVPIDEMAPPTCDFVKIDCEGFEVRALKGAANTIRRHRPVMLIEINAGALERQGVGPADVFAILAHHGYRWRNIYPGQPMRGPQYDILCIPNDKPPAP